MSERPVFSILHATARLPFGWKPAYRAWCERWQGTPAEYLLAVEKKDWNKWQDMLQRERPPLPVVGVIPLRFVVESERSGSSVANWNAAAQESTGEILCLAEDDLKPCQDWDLELLQVVTGRYADRAITAKDAEFIIEVSTGRERDGELIANAVMSRKLYERWGYFYWPEYESMYADDDLTAHARMEGVVLKASDIRFQHTPLNDEVRGRQNRSQAYVSGQRIFNQRRLDRFQGIPGIKKPSRTIALCLAGEHFQGAWVDGILDLWEHLFRKGFDIIKLRGYTSNVYVTREEIRTVLMDANMPRPDLILWLDDDNICIPGHFDQLLEDLASRPDVDGVFGWCWIHNEEKTGFQVSCGTFGPDGSRWIPFHQSFANTRELRPVEASGFPCVLMRYSALQKAGDKPFIRGILDPGLPHGIGGEDMAFCRAAAEGGAKFLVDPLVQVPHLKYVTVEPVVAEDGKAPVKIAVMIRVKNEARWIGRVIDSVKMLGPVFVMDDGSTDHTVSIAEEHGASVWSSPFIGDPFNEVRDKNWLLEIVKRYANLDLTPPDWILMLDGDEELEGAGAEKIRRACESGLADVFSIPVLMLWDRPDQVRLDGHTYRECARMSLFRVIPGMQFASVYKDIDGCNQTLHAPNAPLDGPEVLRQAHVRSFLFHYGCMLKEDRIRKYHWYNSIDPNNEVEDCYRHTVQGDIPEVPAEAVLKYAGPLEIRKLPRSLQPKDFDFDSLKSTEDTVNV